jgi:hypothetical protein
MDRTPATHATHDELLLARLYGGDVDERERRRALDQMAACQDCANVFADLGSIAVATAALPTPPRSRNFTLTEADAARLGRRSVGWAIFDWLGRTKALGGSMVAAGLVGVVLVGALSVFGQSGGSATLDGQTSVAAPLIGGAPGYEANGSASPAPGKNGADRNGLSGGTAAGAGLPGSTAAPPVAAASPAQPPAPAASALDTGKLAFSTEQPGSSGAAAFGPSNPGQGGFSSGSSTVPAGAGSPHNSGPASPAGGPDPRSVALVAFAGLLILGVLLLAVPRMAARRARRQRA